jgi:hypothetical protein
MRWKEAEELQIQVTELAKKALGRDYSYTLLYMSNLAGIWKSQGRNLEAILLLKDCFQLQRHKLGPQHLDVKRSRELLNKWQMES